MKKELYQCTTIGRNGESQNIYFDTLYNAKEYARSNKCDTITRIVGDMEIVETYEWSSRGIKRTVIEETWDWYPKGENEEIS